MMMLPSETPPGSWTTVVVALLTTLGAGGILKLVQQWQAGRAEMRGEYSTRIRHLEETVAALQDLIGDLREENGRLKAELDFLKQGRAGGSG